MFIDAWEFEKDMQRNRCKNCNLFILRNVLPRSGEFYMCEATPGMRNNCKREHKKYMEYVYANIR